MFLNIRPDLKPGGKFNDFAEESVFLITVTKPRENVNLSLMNISKFSDYKRMNRVIFLVAFACMAKKLSRLFYYFILLFQLSVANPEYFEEFKAREVLKIRKEKTGISPTSLVPTSFHPDIKKVRCPGNEVALV